MGSDEAPSNCAKRIWCTKLVFQILGALVGISFSLQGVRIFVGPAWGNEERPGSFWELCYWASEGSLCIAVGFCAFVLEVRSCTPQVSKHLAAFASNRIGLALVYLWMGGYSSGGRIKSGGAEWQWLGQITGFLAWLVCLGHILLSCCAEKSTAEELRAERARASMKVQSAPEEPTTVVQEPPKQQQYANLAGYGISAAPAANPWAVDEPDGSEPAPQAEPEPSSQHQWSSFGGGKPFGCA